MASSNLSRGGLAVFVGTVQFSILLIVAEALYPGYNVSVNAISDLGATCSPTYQCTVSQPSSNIFNGSLIILGLLLILGTYLMATSHLWRPLVISIGIAGIGTLGVGLFPETAGSIHGVVSLIAFLFSGVSAVLSFKVLRSPLRYVSVALGIMCLSALVLFLFQSYLGLGLGGMERMILYPALLWYFGFSAQLIERNSA